MLLALVSVLTMPGASDVEAASSQFAVSKTPVLLTFDVETDADIAALNELNLKVPTTHFLLGQFVERHSDFVRKLATGDVTLGSHSYSHPHLKDLSGKALREELLKSVTSFEAVLGYKPRWFRAPFLEYSDEAMKVLRDLKVEYDSSDQERWRTNKTLPELPISGVEELLASDFDIFLKENLDHAAALRWLNGLFEDRRSSQKPVVILMHPRIIVQHAQVLHDFIDHVVKNDGVFVTADSYVERALSRRPQSLGVWVDLSLGRYDPRQIVADALKLGADDVFVMAQDPDGNAFFRDRRDDGPKSDDAFGRTVQAVKAAGLRAHAWVPVNANSRRSRERPEWAMVDNTGKSSSQWLSPSHPAARAHFLRMVSALIDQYSVDGIHLDYIRYPGFEFDFSQTAITKFRNDSGIGNVPINDILSTHWLTWVGWRKGEITQLVREVRAIIRDKKSKNIALSAALVGDAAVDYESADRLAQDYAALGRELDVTIPMAYFNESKERVDWVSRIVFASRTAIGEKSLYTGLEAYKRPPDWGFDLTTFSTALDRAWTGSDGIVFYSYGNLFGRGPARWDLPKSAIKQIELKLGAERTEKRGADRGGARQGAHVPSPLGDDPAAPHPEYGRIPSVSTGLISASNASDVLPDTGIVRAAAVPSAGGGWLRAVTTPLLDLASQTRSHLQDQRLHGVGVVMVGGAALLIIAPLLLLGAIRRGRSRRLKISGVSALAGQANSAPNAMDWRELIRRCEQPVLSVETWSHVSAMLRALSSSRIEQNRVCFVLDLIRSAEGSFEEISKTFQSLPGWSVLGVRYLEEASLLGYTRLGEGRLEISEHGEAALARGLAEGYDRMLWEFIERRLHETLVVECPSCGELNLSQWFWADFTCRRCRTRTTAEGAGRIVRRTMADAPLYYQRI
jgi:peptidoglycan/xylan/chitin deacetylase (PgdA/CDA1 family)